MPQIIFQILNYKTYQDTINVSRELLNTERKDFKILIVDNASSNESFKKLQEVYKGNNFVDVIESPINGGFAKGNNYGLHYMEKYNPEYVCIINNDVHFSWDTISALLEWYKKLENPAFLSPVQKLPDGTAAKFTELKQPSFLSDLKSYTLFGRLPEHVYNDNTNIPFVQRVDIIPGAFQFVSYKIFKDLGFFDEDTFLFCEERFLGRKVKDNGLNNYIILNLYYTHEHSKTINKEASQKKQREFLYEGKMKYWRRYSKYPNLVCMILTMMKNLNELEFTVIDLLRPIKKLIVKLT